MKETDEQRNQRMLTRTLIEMLRSGQAVLQKISFHNPYPHRIVVREGQPEHDLLLNSGPMTAEFLLIISAPKPIKQKKHRP